MMLPENPNWQMTLLFLLALASLGFAMKLVALLLPTKSQIQRRGISWVLVYHVTDRALFGSMMTYFLLQPVGTLVERSYLQDHPHLITV